MMSKRLVRLFFCLLESCGPSRLCDMMLGVADVERRPDKSRQVSEIVEVMD